MTSIGTFLTSVAFDGVVHRVFHRFEMNGS